MTGFSKQGLIDQLSSSAGDGYSVSDAAVAVDSLSVDWNRFDRNAEAGSSALDERAETPRAPASQREALRTPGKNPYASASLTTSAAGRCRASPGG